MEEKWNGISASTLKIIAIISMIIDHFAYSLYSYLPHANLRYMMVMRYIGRIAFPIYCFLLVEGFFYTKSIKRYIGRMFAFSLISEIPFDMAFSGKIVNTAMQNVYFTLTLGLVVLYLIHQCRGYDAFSMLKQFVIIVLGATIGQYAEVDYHWMGILFIVMFYYLRESNIWIRDLVGVCAFAYEKTAPLAFIPIHFYNGKRGLRLKYFFYWIYPVHLLLFGCIRMFLLIRL